jgi:hypothetical protein
MLEVVSVPSSSSSSLSESSASKSIKASPPTILDLVISSVMVVSGSKLPNIPEMLELEVAQYTITTIEYVFGLGR